MRVIFNFSVSFLMPQIIEDASEKSLNKNVRRVNLENVQITLKTFMFMEYCPN